MPIRVSQLDDAVPSPGLLTDPQLAGVRLTVHCYLRFAVAVTIAVGALFAHHVVGIHQLDVIALVGVAVAIAAYNIIVMAIIAPYRRAGRLQHAYRVLRGLWHATVTADYIALAVLVYLVGGVRSPFLAFFLLHLVLSAIMLSRLATVFQSIAAYLILCMLVYLEWSGVLMPRLPLGAVISDAPLDGRYALTILVVYGVLFVSTGFMLTSLAQLLRSGERQLSDANAELQRLNQNRRDFLHVALHNLKSPVGVVTMMLKNILAGFGGPVTDQQKQWIDRSLERLQGSTEFLRDLQMLAAIESGDLHAQMKPIDLHAMLDKLVQENRDLAADRQHALLAELPDTLPQAQGIERLVREAIVNFITNAIKYTPEGGRIIVRASATGDGMIRIEVTDNGIGISTEDQERLFQDFVRIPRPETPVADAPGTGLGLSIVKRIIEAHGGMVGVSSTTNAGATFYATVPQATDDDETGAASG